MLQAIRSKATSFVVKILFGVLIVTFAIWGIGDIFRNRSIDTTVATVGDRDISAQEMQAAVQAQMQRLEKMLGRPVDMAQAKQLGIVNLALQQLVSADLMDNEIDRLHLKLGNDVVRQAIINNPNFHNQSGVFDRDVLANVLAANHLSESQFETLFRADLLQDQLTSALVNGWTAPKELVDTLYRREFEKRVVETVTLPASAAGTIPDPKPAQLDVFYQKHKDRFRAPELRSFTLALLDINAVAATINVPPDKLKQEYLARADEFNLPEQRHLQQMLLPDEAKAKAAEADLAQGKDFAAVAKSVAGADPTSIDLGWMKRSDLPDPLAGAAFALKAGETSKPLHSAFGWHILRVLAIKPPSTASLASVKDKLTKEVQLDMAGDQIAKMANEIDDALAGGTSLADIAKKFALKTEEIKAVSAGGKLVDGKDVDLGKHQDDILKLAFSTGTGQTSALTQLGEDGYCIVQTQTITPAAVRPLAAVHDEAMKMWQTEQRNLALAKAATAIADQINAGKSFKEVAAAQKLTIKTSAPLLRSSHDKGIPTPLLRKIFLAKPGEAVAGQDGDAAMVAQVASIEAADPSKDAEVLKRATDKLGDTMKDDFLGDFDQALRKQYPVEINQTNLDRAL